MLILKIQGTAGKFMAACSFYIAQTSARGWFGSGAAKWHSKQTFVLVLNPGPPSIQYL